MEQKSGKNSLFGELTPEKSAGLAYSAGAILLVLLSLVFLAVVNAGGLTAAEGFEESDWYLYCGFLLPQLAFAAVAAIFFLKTKTPLKKLAGGCSPKYFLLAVVLQFGLLSLSELNNLFLHFLEGFGYEPTEILLPSSDGFGFVGVLYVVAVLPAVLEEMIFRGILFGGLKSCGRAGAVLVCGALFALYHQSPAQTVYQFLCGAAFALMMLRAGSILPTVLSHFLNNALIIVLDKAGVTSFSVGAMIPLMIGSALCLLGSLAYLIFFDKSGEAEKTPARKDFFLFAAVGIAVYAVSWISALLTGFGG